MSLPENQCHLALLEAAMRAWPADQSRYLDGWYLRQSADVTKRCNSALPIRQAEQWPLDDHIAACEQFYSEAGQRTVFQINQPVVPEDIVTTLHVRGYQRIDASFVATMELSESNSTSEVLEFEHRSRALVMNAILPPQMPDSARQARARLFNAIRKPKTFAIACQGGEPLAGGLVVVDGLWAGIFNMYTHPMARRQGLASQVLDGLLSWAARFGARFAYLQVEKANLAACNLYAERGFRHAFDYHYLVAPD